MQRRTKIVATLGPATDDPEVLDGLIRAGVDVVRINFSHGTAAEHLARAEALRNRARAAGREVGVLVDLQGPKIRIERFKDGKIQLKEDDPFILDALCPSGAGTQERVGVTYKALPADVSCGDTLLLDDGHIVLRVQHVSGSEIACRVLVGGELSNSKGINRQGGGLSAQALTAKDRADIKVAAQLEADYLALSFVQVASGVQEARELLREAGGRGGIVAKIERAEAMEGIEAIIAAADAVMVARGDLGVEIGDAKLPAAQKHIISLARCRDRVAITATHMLQSMVESPIPTRAEVSDVANAVMDGTDAVLLTAETAVGKFPVKAVEAMDRICREAEKAPEARLSDHRLNTRFDRIDEAIAMSTMYAANHSGIKAIAALTESGSTVLWMSRISSAIPIYALTRHQDTRRKVTLYRGVYPVSFDVIGWDSLAANREVINELLRQGAVRADDLVIITKGDMDGVAGGTNVMKIVRVGHYPHAQASDER